MHIQLDRHSKVPLYKQIIAQIAGWARSGELPPGAILPSVRQLTKDLGVGIRTVRQAYDELRAQGVIDTVPGGGTFIADRPGGVDLAIPRAEMQTELNNVPRMIWEPYKFDSTFFGLPRTPGRTDDLIDLSRAQPDPSLFPFERIKAVIRDMLWNPREFFFDRGHAQGYMPLVEWIENEMQLTGVTIGPKANGVILTAGFQRALSLLLDIIAGRGDQVAVEQPTYASILNLLIAKGIRAVGIPMDGAGMDTEYLAQILTKERIKAVITVPTYHNPTGTVMSNERRAHLLKLAVMHRLPVIEDDWGRPLRYTGEAVPPLKAVDPGGYVIHVGSFSKTFLPGLRIGWITVPADFAVTLIRAKLAADKGDSWFLQVLLHEFILKGHYDKHLRRSVRIYKHRRQTMLKALRDHLPHGVSWIEPPGGLSVWVKLPARLPSTPLLVRARQQGVSFAPAQLFNPGKEDGPQLRLSFSRCDHDEITDGVKRLGHVIAEALAGPGELVREGVSFRDLED